VRHDAIWNIIFAYSMANMPSFFHGTNTMYSAIKKAEEKRCFNLKEEILWSSFKSKSR
jgi:hypothetical protein